VKAGVANNVFKVERNTMNNRRIIVLASWVVFALCALNLEGGLTQREGRTPLEVEIEEDIELWNRKNEGKSCAMWDFMTELCRKVKEVPSVEKRIVYLRQLTDKALAVKFEDGPKFPLEFWGTEPFSMSSSDAKLALRGRHEFVVASVRELYRGIKKADVPFDVQFEPIFRLAEKIDVEKARLKALDVGGASYVLDEAECDLYELTKGEMTEYKKVLLNRFEATFYRPIRSPEEIAEDRQKLDEAIATAVKRKLKSCRTKETMRRHGEFERKWNKEHGVKRPALM